MSCFSLWRIVCLFFCVLFLAACQEAPPPAEAPPAAVSVYEAQAESVSRVRQFVARTEANKDAQLVARLEGTLEEVLFREGSLVEAGTLLARIESNSYRATDQQSRADLAAKRESFEVAKRNLERGKDLAPRGFLSQSDLDDLQDKFSSAQSALRSAEAQVEKTAIDLDYTEIRAPFTGRIGKLYYSQGNVVGPQTGPIADILAVDPIYVNFQVNEADWTNYQQQVQAAGVDANDLFAFHLILPNGEQYSQTGRISFADVRGDSGTGTVNLRAEFPNPDALVLPGLNVTLKVETQKRDERVVIPQMAVQESLEGKFVLVVGADNTVSQRIVVLGQRRGPMWVVDSGLEPGEQVIVEGLQKVRAGAKVAPVIKQIDPDTGALSEVAAAQPAQADS